MGDDPQLGLLRGVYAEWARGDFSRDDMFHPEVEFVTSQPEPRTYRGREGAREAWSGWLTAWEEFRVEAEDFVSAGADRYVALVRLTGRGKESHVPTGASTANLIEFRGGRISRFALYWDREEALRAAGVEPERSA